MCGLVAVVLSILYLMVFRHSPGKQATEVGALSIYFAAFYVVAAMVSNTVFILSGHGEFNKLLLLSNVIVNAIYIFLILCVEKSVYRLSQQLARTEQKLSGAAGISAKLGEMLSIVEDDAIRKQILKLKEAVQYSSNMTTDSTVQSERTMAHQLDELMSLINDQAELSAIQSKIREVEITWKTRSNAASSM